MTTTLDFINRIRTLQGLPERGALPLLGSEPDDAHNCVLATALGVPVGESEHPNWAVQGRWVMRFADRLTAQRVGIGTGQEWLGEPPEVRLPDALIDLAVAQHLDVAVGDEEGFVRGWWVPDAEGFPVFHTPTASVIPGNCGVPAAAA